jgi:hypothetical protein
LEPFHRHDLQDRTDDRLHFASFAPFAGENVFARIIRRDVGELAAHVAAWTLKILIAA